MKRFHSDRLMYSSTGDYVLYKEAEIKLQQVFDAWDDLLEDMELQGMHSFEPYIKSKANFTRLVAELLAEG